VVPVRFPPSSSHSEATLREAAKVAEDRDADLTVLHVDLYQNSGGVSRGDLKRAVEQRIGRLDRARYVVRRGFLVEETILEEIVAEGADVVVIGSKQAGRWRRMVQKLLRPRHRHVPSRRARLHRDHGQRRWRHHDQRGR